MKEGDCRECKLWPTGNRDGQRARYEDVSNIVQQGAIEPMWHRETTGRVRQARRTGDRARCAHHRAFPACAPIVRESIDAIGGHRLLSALSPATLHVSLRSAEHFLAWLQSRSTSHWHTLDIQGLRKGNRASLPCTLPILGSIDRLLSPDPPISFILCTCTPNNAEI